MSARYVAAATLVALIAQPATATAADWRAITRVKLPGLTVEIDAESAVRSGDMVTAWTRDTYDTDQLMFQRGAFMYRTSTVRTEFDCAQRTFRLLTFFYSDDSGKVLQRTAESDTSHMKHVAAVPETIGEAMLAAACALR